MTGRDWKISAMAAALANVIFASGLLVVFTPFPMFFVAIMHGRRAGRISMILSLVFAALVYLLIVPLLGTTIEALAGTDLNWQIAKISYFVYFLIFAFFFEEAVSRKWHLSTSMVVPVVVTFILAAGAFAGLELAGYGLIDGIRAFLQATLSQVIASQESAGANVERLSIIKDNAKEIVAFSMRMIPSVVLLTGVIVGMLNIVLAKWLIKKDNRLDSFGDLYEFSMPHWLVWLAIVFGFGFFFEKYVFQSSVLNAVVINCLIVLAGIYFLQGIFILSYFIKAVKVKLIRLLFYVLLILFIQASAPVIVVIGFADLWVDFRKYLRKE